jgi:hypothetical protein
MATIVSKPRIELRLTIALTEDEARALDALAGYGDDEFIKAFYEVLGKAYMEPHEAGLRLFLSTIREEMPRQLARVDEARKLFEANQ